MIGQAVARKIADALRVTLSPQEQEELAAKPTENLQAYDLCLRGRSYARRLTRQDFEFALAHAAIAKVCAQYHYNYERKKSWLERCRDASRRATTLQPRLPEVNVAQAWLLYTQGEHGEAIHVAREAVASKRDTEGAYYILLRALGDRGERHRLQRVCRAPPGLAARP